MATLRDVLEPISDRINFDDVSSGTITAKIESVKITDDEKPRAVCYLEGYSRPYIPCKTMSRLLGACWDNEDHTKWIGQSLTLFGDPDVIWGGKAEGGVRVSHVTGINKPITVTITKRRGVREPFTVNPLVITPKQATEARISACKEFLAAKGITEADAEKLINKPLEQATDKDLNLIGKEYKHV